MDTTMFDDEYQSFKYSLRELNPKLTAKQCKEIYKTVYGVNTIADTPPTLGDILSGGRKTNQEGITLMFNDECAPCTRIKKSFVSAPVANAQVIASVPVEASQRDYAIARIKAIGEKHAAALRVQFNMDSKTPQTFLELEAIIKAGDYTVTDIAKGEDAQYYSLFHGVKFGKPADKEGYAAAKAVLTDECQRYLDIVTMKTIDEAFAALDAFKAWTLPTTH